MLRRFSTCEGRHDEKKVKQGEGAAPRRAVQRSAAQRREAALAIHSAARAAGAAQTSAAQRSRGQPAQRSAAGAPHLVAVGGGGGQRGLQVHGLLVGQGGLHVAKHLRGKKEANSKGKVRNWWARRGKWGNWWAGSQGAAACGRRAARRRGQPGRRGAVQQLRHGQGSTAVPLAPSRPPLPLTCHITPSVQGGVVREPV